MNANAIPVLENKMVETAYRVRKAVTEYTKIILLIQNRTIDHPVYGQDIAIRKMERIFASSHFTHYRETSSRRHDSNLWR